MIASEPLKKRRSDKSSRRSMTLTGYVKRSGDRLISRKVYSDKR